MLDLTQLSQVFSWWHFKFNLLDLIIFVVFLFYAYEGYVVGFITSLADFGSFILAFILALKIYSLVGILLIKLFKIPQGFANALGFFITALLLEIALGFLFRKLSLAGKRFLHNTGKASFINKLDNLLGVLPGFASAFVILSFLLTVIVSFPASPVLKNLITTSRLGPLLLANTANLEKSLNNIFGGALSDTLNFLTVEPKSNESVDLHFKVANPVLDTEAEEKMLAMVNQERVKRGLSKLIMDPRLRSLARDYSADMLKNGYFSHYNLQGESPFDRMAKRNITYQYAGENLALAPTTDLAMQGLMNSPGHRANMLNPHFGHVGIGVMDGGIYGKMFTQEFTD